MNALAVFRVVTPLVLLLGGQSFVCGQEIPDESDSSADQGLSSSRPFSGLFGGASVRTDRKQSLTLNGSVFISYIEDVTGDPERTQRATYRGASSELRYNRRWTDGRVGAFAGGSFAYVPEFKDVEGGQPWLNRWSAGADASGSRRLGRRTRAHGTAEVLYTPYFEYGNTGFSAGTIAAPTNVPGLDYVITRAPSVMTRLEGTITQQLSSRASIDALYLFRDRSFTEIQPGQTSQQEQAAGGYIRYRLRYASVRAGYMYRLSNYGTGGLGRIGRHEIDVGLDGMYGLGRSYALDRRTTFQFAISPSVFAGERYLVQPGRPGEPAQTASDPRLRLFIGGNADLTRTFGRTWAARAQYQRSAGYEDGFDRPFLSNSASAGLSGLITQRVDFSAVTTYSTGTVGFSGPNSDFSRQWSTVSLRGAITRALAAYVQYFKYRYEFGSGVRLPLGFTNDVDRQGVSGGLSIWVPLW